VAKAPSAGALFSSTRDPSRASRRVSSTRVQAVTQIPSVGEEEEEGEEGNVGENTALQGVHGDEWKDGASRPVPLENSKMVAVKQSRKGKQVVAEAPKVLEGNWGKFKGYSVLQRSLMIWTFVFKFFVKRALVNKKWTYSKRQGGMTEEAVKARKAELAVWLRDGLLRLGPTFIKIGQQFSTRVDLLDPVYIKELEQLQDNVPPFASDLSVRIVASELGGSPESLFARFDTTPLKAASLGQVHRAQLKDGREVVVKVQRPALKELFDIDLKNLRVLAQKLQDVDPKSDGAKRDWVAIYDECSRVLYEEIDYTVEGRNCDRFRKNFEAESWAKVPEIYWDYSSEKVLTMEYCPGVKISDTEAIDRMGVDRARLARILVEGYLLQVLRHGFFHADPHPGNISVDATGGGRLVYYDFGMTGSLPGNVKEGLSGLFNGVYNRNADACLDACVTMGVLVPGQDRTAVRRTAQYFLDQFAVRLAAQRREGNKQGRGFRLTQPKTKEEKQEKKEARLAAIGEDLLTLSVDQPFRFPASFTFVVRAFSVLDGIGKGLDPAFDISEISRPYASELLDLGSDVKNTVLTKYRDLAVEGMRNQNKAFGDLFLAQRRTRQVADVARRIETGEFKPRVRALELERAFKRVELQQTITGKAVLCATLANVAALATAHRATMASLALASGVSTPVAVETVGLAATLMNLPTLAADWATAMFPNFLWLAAGVIGLQIVMANKKLKKLRKTELLVTGSASK